MSEFRYFIDYQESSKLKEKEWENLCLRCGGCCGAYDDPCSHLAEDKTGKYYCRIYAKRLGERKALSGEEFDCVPIGKILGTRWKKDYLCRYKKHLKG
tara:strand:- start:357 stop:650 length:294 start_codon:yes stop_codon:yes gene_type:complete